MIDSRTPPLLPLSPQRFLDDPPASASGSARWPPPPLPPRPAAGLGRGPTPRALFDRCGGQVLLLNGLHEEDVESADAAEALCERTVAQPAVLAAADEDAQAMLSHWYTSFLEDVAAFLSSAESHVVLAPMLRREVPTFLDTIGLFTPFCFLRQQRLELPTCFCAAQEGPRLDVPQGYHQAAARSLGIPLPSLPARPHAGIVVRQNRRFVFNAAELLEAAARAGYTAELLPLERMTVREQVEAVARASVLFGLHGAGLTQALWLPSGAAVVQWVPQGVTLDAPRLAQWFAEAAPHVRVVTCYNPDRARSVRSGWRRPGVETPFAAEAMGDAGQNSDFFRFWVNQDAIVQPEVFEALLRHLAAARGAAGAAGAGGAGQGGSGGGDAKGEMLPEICRDRPGERPVASVLTSQRRNRPPPPREGRLQAGRREGDVSTGGGAGAPGGAGVSPPASSAAGTTLGPPQGGDGALSPGQAAGGLQGGDSSLAGGAQQKGRKRRRASWRRRQQS